MNPMEQLAQEAQKQQSATPDIVIGALDVGTHLITSADEPVDAALSAITESASALADAIPDIAAEGATTLAEAAGEFFAGLF